MRIPVAVLSLAIAAALALPSQASSPMVSANVPQRSDIPRQQHTLAFFVERFRADLASTEHVYDIDAGRGREAALRALDTGWQTRLREFKPSELALEDRIDYALLDRELGYRLQQLDFERTRHDEAMARLVLPFFLLRFEEQPLQV